MSQDTIVADFTSHVSTGASTLVSTLLSYHATLSELLFETATLDDAHKTQIRELSKADLIRLRTRLESLTNTVRSATAAPDI